MKLMFKSLTLFIGVIAAASIAFAQDAPEPAPPESPVIALDTPFASFDDMSLSLGDFVYANRDRLRFLFQAPPEDQQNTLLEAVQTTFFERALYDEAMASGFDDDPEIIARKLIMEADFLSRIYGYLNFTQTFVAQEDDLQRVYEENKDKYFDPKTFSFRHIFFRTIDLPEAEQKQAEERAHEALALIRSGSDFLAVADEYSDSSRKGELIGPLKTREDSPETAINPDLEDALLAMKPGDVSDVIQTKYGYEILMLAELTEDSYRPMARVRPDLTNILRREKYEEWKDGLIADNWDKMIDNVDFDVYFDEGADSSSTVLTFDGEPVPKRVFEFANKEAAKKDDESDAAYRERIIDAFKNGILTQMVLAELARSEGYEKIPAYQLLTRIYEIDNVHKAWFEVKAEEHFEENPITDDDEREFYDSRRNLFVKKPKVRMSEMTFNIAEHDEESKYEVYKAQTEARERAEEAIRRVKAGEEFATVAEEMSDSPSAADGGELGVVTPDDAPIPPSIVTRVARQEVGEVNEEPHKLMDSYYVFMLQEKFPAEYHEFGSEEANELIDSRLVQLKRNQYYNTLKDETVPLAGIDLIFEGFLDLDLSRLEPLDYSIPEGE